MSPALTLRAVPTMPYTLHIDEGRHLAILTGSGRVTGIDVIDALLDLFLHDRWQAGMSVIWDTRDVDDLVLEPGDFGRYSQFTASISDRVRDGKVAVLVGRENIERAVMVLASFAQYADRQIQAFRSLDDAQAWLGVPSLPPELERSP